MYFVVCFIIVLLLSVFSSWGCCACNNPTTQRGKNFMVRKAFCVLLLLTPFKHGQVPGVRHLLPEAGGCWTYSATLLLLIASSKQIQNSWSRVFFFFFFFFCFFFQRPRLSLYFRRGLLLAQYTPCRHLNSKARGRLKYIYSSTSIDYIVSSGHGNFVFEGKNNAFLRLSLLTQQHAISAAPAGSNRNAEEGRTRSHTRTRFQFIYWMEIISDSDSYYDSPPPPQPAMFFTARSVAARHEKGCHEKRIPKRVLVCKGLSRNDVRVARSTVFKEIRPGAGRKIGDFVKEKLGGLP